MPVPICKLANSGKFTSLQEDFLSGYCNAWTRDGFTYYTMPSLTNYLQANRKRASFTQEEVAFLLGVTGMNKNGKVSRDEKSARVPTLETALAYEAIYGKPIRELFAGMYEEIEQRISSRAKILRHRMNGGTDPKKCRALVDLTLRSSMAVA